MPKNIVFAADGTWDTPSNETNVERLYNALLKTPTQLGFYEKGVGTNGLPLQQLLGAALGDGLVQKVKEGYLTLAQVYEPGDQIYIFGFSRGAFTARSMAGMIANCGLPAKTPDGAFSVDQVFAAYRDVANRAALLQQLAAYQLVDCKIRMLGVWDTVGSLGIPALNGGIDPKYGFLDTTLHPDVENAYHAVSIDERRREFPSTLWTGDPSPGQVLEQVYFAGVHCDVGGGYDDSLLSFIPLHWMMSKASNLGLTFDPAVYSDIAKQAGENALATQHESWSAIWGDPIPRMLDQYAVLGDSVAERFQNLALYRPGNLVIAGGAPSTDYGIQSVMPV